MEPKEVASHAGLKALPDEPQWYALRDLKRPNALLPAWRQLADLGIHTFTPLRWEITPSGRRQRAVIPDLLFAQSTRALLDPVISRTPTLQYRYRRGAQALPITVGADDMDRFIAAVSLTDQARIRYYTPGELRPDMLGREIRIVGGPLDTVTGRLLHLRGSRIKRLIVEIPGFITAAVEVQPQYVQLLPRQ